jgi:aminopeptidase N
MKQRSHLTIVTLLVAHLVLGWGATQATAQLDPRVDIASGRHRANYPLPRHFDHRHMLLEIDFPDMREPRLSAKQVLTVAPVGAARSVLRLDAVELDIRSISRDGKPLAFTYDRAELLIELGSAVPEGEEIQITIEYDVHYPSGNGIGLTWTPGDPDAASLTARSPQIHAQGEPQSNSRWFPCHDFPNERTTTELVVTAEEAYQVVSNGRLVYRSPSGDGRVTWHWLQDKPHPYYLVTLVVGQFAEVELGGEGSERPGLPMTVYTPHGTEDNVARTFARTPIMIARFEALFDEPFPWDKYDQLMVRNFAAGAMENTSATTFAEMFANTPIGATEGVIAHELTHQWFGDLVTCKGWEHLWLNEGWASYGEALWARASAEPGEERAAYLASINGFLRRQTAMNQGFAPTFPAMVSRYYDDPQLTFMKADDVYAKGALVLHMLHERLGEEDFWRAVRLYLDRFQNQMAETDDFRHVLEEVSGIGLEPFFDQWVYRPGLPRLRVDADWDDSANALQIAVEQTQMIDEANPAYVFVLPVRVIFADGSTRTVAMDVDGRSAGGSFSFSEKPVDIEVNPEITVAAAVRTKHTLSGDR